jgi:hypothetical protein
MLGQPMDYAISSSIIKHEQVNENRQPQPDKHKGILVAAGGAPYISQPPRISHEKLIPFESVPSQA